MTIRTLVEGIIDYAGLFPPAQLDMPETLRNYTEYLRGSDSWMLGRLVVPVARLDQFETVAQALTCLPRDEGAEPWQLSAIATPEGLARDLERIDAFNAAHADPAAGLASIGSIELRGADVAAVEAALDAIPDELFPFFEIDVAADPRGLLAALSGCDAGAKVRTGGAKPESVPTPAQLARFLHAAAAAEVPFKATAGLHHPLRHRLEATGACEFGYINVFAAAAIAWGGGSSETELRGVLEQEEPGAFAFGAEGLRYGRREISGEDIARARRSFAVSFGSCSFTEPLDGLRALKLL